MSGGFRSRSRSGDRPRTHGKDAWAAKKSAPKKETKPDHKNERPEGHRTAGGGGRRGEAGSSRQLRNKSVDLPRQVVYDVLLKVEHDGAYANLALPPALDAAGLNGRDAAFATELTYGTLRNQGVVDAVLGVCMDRDPDTSVRVALRMGAYQLLYLRVSDHAAVDTSVELVVGKARGFVNAVLRRVARTPLDQWLHRLSPADPLEALALRSNHPTWIVKAFDAALDGDRRELEAALDADSQRPTVHLAARPGEISAEELALITGGTQGRYSPYAVYLEQGGDPGALDPIRQRLAMVQDEGSQLIARAVSEVPLEGPDDGRWLDLCAGPGGKAALLGALAAIDSAHVTAVEPAAHRARLVRRVTDGLPVEVIQADGRTPELEPGFDRVLVDVPCSGLGALRRRPEARWRKTPEDIAELQRLQKELLASALHLVRPGGVVVYSTCSPVLEETRHVVEDVPTHDTVVEIDIREYLAGMPCLGPGPSAQMWPHRHGTDAMFVAALRKQ